MSDFAWFGIGIVLVLAVIVGIYGYFKVTLGREKRLLAERETEFQKEKGRQLYELAILKAIGDRIGYSLNIQNIAEVITGSLHQLIQYSVVAYMLIEPEKIVFRAHLEESVTQPFINDLRGRMLSSLSALLNKDLTKAHLEEVLSGAVLIEDVTQAIGSFFNIPLIIGDRVMGVITVGHIKEGLYKEEEMTILYKITKQASFAVTQLEEVVRTEQRKLNAMVESMSEGVVMTDKNYAISVVNPAARKIVGLSGEKNITIFDFIDVLGGKFDIRGRLEESIQLKKVITLDEMLLADRYYQILVSPVISEDATNNSEVLGGVIIFHDITSEKEAERLREDFTAMMVHELRGPLTGIRSIAELFQDDISVETKKAEVDAESVGLIYDSSSQMLELVNDLLDVAKIESGKFEIDKAEVSLAETIDHSVKLFASVAGKKGLNLRTAIAPGTPANFVLDQKRMGQVLNNLLSNSIKFTDKGGSVTVQALLHRKDSGLLAEASAANFTWYLTEEDSKQVSTEDCLVLAVTDTGAGISKEEQAQLFSKFKQFAASARSESKGTGLGLVIIKGIVEAHGGKVRVASEKNVGTTFYITLPFSAKK